MSHYVTLVLLPSTTKPADYEDEIAKRIARYDEGTEVAPYMNGCYCIGRAALAEVDREVDEKLGTIEKLRADFHAAAPDVEDPKDEDRRWKVAVAPRAALRKALLDAHPGADKPADDCPECKGTGKYETTYNPESKWDWWVIGGRWAGYLDGKRANAMLAKKLIARTDDEWIPFAIITPDGEWHEKGKMRWFAMVEGEVDEDEWVKQARALVAANPETVAVAVDMHI
jgi:hypothetical protein